MATREGATLGAQQGVPPEGALSERYFIHHIFAAASPNIILRDKVLYEKILDTLQEIYADQEWSASDLRDILRQNLMKRHPRAQLHKIAQSEVTDETRSVAASTLVLKAEEWQDWALSINLNLRTDGISFQEIETIKAGVRYPVNLNSLEEEYYASIEHGTTFVRSIRNWIASDRSIVWDSNPQYPPFWDLLINEWSFVKDAVADNDYEAGQRCLIDCMMILIFSRSLERQHRFEVLLGFIFSMEKELALPGPRSSLPPRLKSSYAKPDVAIMKDLPDSADILSSTREAGVDQSVVHCLKHWSPGNTVLLGVFVVEDKQLDDLASPRQLSMYCSSMQYQRRALGLKSKPIYGATATHGVFQLYACFWGDKGRLWCRKVRDACWDLSRPDEFIQCLYFLRTLRQHIDASLEDDLRSFSIDRFVAKIQRNPENWRDRPSKRMGDSQDKGSKRPRPGEGPGDDDISVDEEDDLSECSLQTPRMRLARIIDIVFTSNEKACQFVRWLNALPSNEHKETYGRQICF
ncbi:hypothetical protein A7U60_g9058 [Sanghuangporus baumii]|uniref:Uncharacterized protein n=1 Tax=Sanghuangporus baumii TaxID=108892 RepID=A0A9Q5MXB7_SANBA|nr:hypothetical protein A7U60_g9058 [Sanghuangporus baumii]